MSNHIRRIAVLCHAAAGGQDTSSHPVLHVPHTPEPTTKTRWRTGSLSHQRRGGGDRRDNLASDLPGAVHVRLWDLVHAGSEVGSRRDEFHVVIDVLVKVNHLQPITSQIQTIHTIRAQKRALRQYVQS